MLLILSVLMMLIAVLMMLIVDEGDDLIIM